MRRPFVVIAVLAALAGCDSKTPVVPTTPSPTPTPVPAVQVAEVTVSGDGRFTALGHVHQFTATARMSDGSQRDVTAESRWTSSDPNVVTVSSSGAVTSVALGLAAISATHGRQGTADVTVAPPGDPSRFSGLFRLGFTAAAECAGLPGWARQREYETTIDQAEELANGVAWLTLTIQLQPGLPERFYGTFAGSRLGLEFPAEVIDYYYFGGPVFSHAVDNANLYELQGQASAVKGGSQVARIAGTFRGFIRAVNRVTNTPIAECSSANHQFTLVRE